MSVTRMTERQTEGPSMENKSLLFYLEVKSVLSLLSFVECRDCVLLILV